MTFWIGINETQYWFMMVTLSIMIVTVIVGTTYAIIKARENNQKILEKKPNERTN